MNKIRNGKLLSCFEDTFDILFSLESIIKITQDACLDKEISAKYYNLPKNKQIILSEERNNYINMLSLALDRLSKLKAQTIEIEEQLTKL